MSIKYLKKDNELLKQLIDFIKEGCYKDGDRLPSERTLAKELNSSRNSLREVLKILQTMDILKVQERSGIYINSIDNLSDDNPYKWNNWVSLHKDTSLDLHNIRTALELKAIELIPFKELSTVGKKLRECILEIDIERCSANGFVEHDIKFHEVIWKACKNNALLNICLDVTNTIYDERIVIAYDEARKKASYAQHKVIAEAFLQCDLTFIKSVCEAHYNSVTHYMSIL